MKVYVVERLWAEDGEDSACYGSGVDKVYANKADATKRMQELAGQEDVPNGWVVKQDDIMWTAYEEGLYSAEHICIFVEEREVK